MAEQVSIEQITGVIESHFRVLSVGLVTCNPSVPSNIMWEAIAQAMGGVLSGATKSPDLASTMAARGHLSDIVAKAIRKRYPAMDMTPANAIQLSQ
jgi:hypothetical protein